MLSRLARFLFPPAQWVVEGASNADILAVADIHAGSFPRGWSDGEFEKMFADANYTFLVARRYGKAHLPIGGFIIVRLAADEAEIISIATDPAYRKKGIARLLLESAIRLLETDRVPTLFLEVDERNFAAIGLYQSLNFEKVGERKAYYASAIGSDEPPSTALVMQRELG